MVYSDVHRFKGPGRHVHSYAGGIRNTKPASSGMYNQEVRQCTRVIDLGSCSMYRTSSTLDNRTFSCASTRFMLPASLTPDPFVAISHIVR